MKIRGELKETIIAAGVHSGMSSTVPGNDIHVHRATNIRGEDMGEWWIQNTRGPGVWRVTDEDMKAYKRETKLKELGIQI